MKKKKKGNKDGKGIRKTEDGLKLYTEEELGMNKEGSGNTADCPFDCNCCF